MMKKSEPPNDSDFYFVSVSCALDLKSKFVRVDDPARNRPLFLIDAMIT